METDRLIARCTPEWIARARELGSRDARPVLIIGMPRSGTTLVEQIVSMHPEVGAGGELHFWNERGAAWHRSGAAGNENPFLAKAAADYLGVLRAIAPRAARVTDKMPFNFLWAGSTWHSRAQSSSIAAAPQSTRRCRSIKLISIRAWRFRQEAPNWSRISAATSGSWTIGEACCRRIASSRSITRT
jgi:hypothetical protein